MLDQLPERHSASPRECAAAGRVAGTEFRTGSLTNPESSPQKCHIVAGASKSPVAPRRRGRRDDPLRPPRSCALQPPRPPPPRPPCSCALQPPRVLRACPSAPSPTPPPNGRVTAAKQVPTLRCNPSPPVTNSYGAERAGGLQPAITIRSRHLLSAPSATLGVCNISALITASPDPERNFPVSLLPVATWSNVMPRERNSGLGRWIQCSLCIGPHRVVGTGVVGRHALRSSSPFQWRWA
jgi:hypothetical protein